MIYKKSEVFSGSFIRMEMEGVFEGICELICAEGDKLTSISSDSSPLIVNQRWKIRFLFIEEVEEELSRKDRLTQIAQRGRLSHRILRYSDGKFEKNYKRHLTKKKESDEDRDLLLDLFTFDAY